MKRNSVMGIVLSLFMVLSLFAGIYPVTSVSAGSPPPTDSLTVIKYAGDGTTVLSQVTLSYTDMEGVLPVQGDGDTHYYMQGPTFDPANLWDPDETLNLKDKGAVKGTDVKDLCELVGGASEGDQIQIKASDGYNERFTYDDVYNPESEQGNFVVCWYTKGVVDNDTGDVYYPDGAYVTEFAEGMQLVFFADDCVFGNQNMKDCLPEDNWHDYDDGSIVYPSCNGLSIKAISEVAIYTEPVPVWEFELDGIDTYIMDQTEFENGVACHGAATWVDGDNTWSGLPLWMLVGYVDDGNQHGPGAFNDEVAAYGYNVNVIASDGYTQTFTSAEVARNDNMIIANMFNGAPLPEDKYPLRLVGPDLLGSQKVSQIAEIELTDLPWSLILDGAGDYLMMQPEFESEAAAGGISWDDEGDVWSGLALWELVAMVDDSDPDTLNDDLVTAGYDVRVVAADGYNQAFPIGDVAYNDNMIIANELNDAPLPEDIYPLRLVGPDLMGSQKVGQVVQIVLEGLAVEEWELTLDGASNYVMTQSEFEEGVECHGVVTWVNGENTWSGMPLWLLCGWVDDDVQHGEGAFNDTLAAAGYSIKVSASDGYYYTFESADVARNDDIIVANSLNGAPLPEDKYPLKIVGPDLGGGAKVAMITTIELLNLPTIEEWELDLVGMGNCLMTQPEFEIAAANPVSWDDEGDIWEGLALWRLAAIVDDDDPTTFNDDMAAAGYEVEVVASDGYSKTFASADVAHNDDMIIADTLNDAALPEDKYPLRLVGPTLSGGQKVSQIVQIKLIIPWELELSGASDYVMTNTEFEATAAVNPVSWDEEGDIWEGIALWRLVAMVDDDDPTTFNDTLAGMGYDIKVIASDGYNKIFSSADVTRNDEMILANISNGYPLPAGRFPLRLVGPSLSGSQKVSQIVRIELVNLPVLMEFTVDHMFVNFTSLRAYTEDTIFANGTFSLPAGVTCDLTGDDVSMDIDGVQINIPAGSFRKLPHREIYTYNSLRGDIPGVIMSLNFTEGTWSLFIRNVDASAVNNYDGVEVVLSIGSVTGLENIEMHIDSLSY